MEISSFIQKCQKIVNNNLKHQLPPSNTLPRNLHKAMNYAVFNGGKRIRSVLIYAANKELGGNLKECHDICVAAEILHAASLIIDDLPALDNASLRRGKLTCHKVLGEATAILASCSLITLAFEVLSNFPKRSSISPSNKVTIINRVSKVIGSLGSAAGEMMDLELNDSNATIKKLEKTYYLKTGNFIELCIWLGAVSANCEDIAVLENLKNFGKCIGILFQIHDDIIGVESSTKILGKMQGADLELHKPVYPVISSMEYAKKREKELYDQAIIYLDKCNMSFPLLKAIATLFVTRQY